MTRLFDALANIAFVVICAAIVVPLSFAVFIGALLLAMLLPL